MLEQNQFREKQQLIKTSDSIVSSLFVNSLYITFLFLSVKLSPR